MVFHQALCVIALGYVLSAAARKGISVIKQTHQIILGVSMGTTEKICIILGPSDPSSSP